MPREKSLTLLLGAVRRNDLSRAWWQVAHSSPSVLGKMQWTLACVTASLEKICEKTRQKCKKPWQNNVGRRLDGLVLVAVLELPGTLSDGHLIYKFNSTFPEPPYHSISLVYNYHLQRILKIWEPNVIHLPIPVEAKPSMECQWDTRLALFKEPLHLPSFKLCCNENKRMSQQLLGPSCWDSQANSSLFKMPGQNFLQLDRTTHIAISSMRSSMIHASVQAETKPTLT